MVYLIGYRLDFDRWQVKIGIAQDVSRRLRQLQTGNSHRLELLHTIQASDPRRIEGQLHRQFRHYRQSGEWFSLTSHQLALLLEVCDRLDLTPNRPDQHRPLAIIAET